MDSKIRVLLVGDSGGSLSEREFMRCLPYSLSKADCEVSVLAPLCGSDVSPSYLAERLFRLEVSADGRQHVLRVLEGKREGGGAIFYLTGDVDGLDEGIVRGLYAHATGEFLMQYPLEFDVVICHGLNSCLVPVFLRESYATQPRISRLQLITSLSDWRDKGLCPLDHIRRLGLPPRLESSEGLEYYGQMSTLKGAYLYSDLIVLPSKRDVDDIFAGDSRGDHGIEGVLLSHRNKVTYVAQGLDSTHWDPGTDRAIASTFSEGSTTGKLRCKDALCKELGIKDSRGILMCYAGLLVERCGIDLISDILDDLMDNGVNLVFTGHGDASYTEAVASWASEFPGRVVLTDCDLVKIRRVFAGSDVILLPQRAQSGNCFHLYAMRYGAIPVARRISSASEDLNGHRFGGALQKQSNSYVFDNYDADEFFDSAMDAVETFADRGLWQKLQSQAMNYCHDWSKCASGYKSLFKVTKA